MLTSLPTLPLIEALRPRQWIKNLVLLAPLLFAHRLFDLEAGARVVAAALIFCLLSGAVYLFNDLRDLESDRHHPVKSRRPLASGRLAEGTARSAFVIIGGVALAGAWMLSRAPFLQKVETPSLIQRNQLSFFACAIVYVLLHVAYSTWLKHVVVLDVIVVAMGFVVRAIAGAAVIAVEISNWLLVCTVFLSLFLVLAKRRHEFVLLADDAREHRRTLGDYDAYLLDQMIAVVAAGCLISYALYTMAPATVEKFHTDRLNVTIPFVIYGLFRYLYLIHRRDGGGDPSASFVHDRPILTAVALWALTVIALLYTGS